MARTPPSYPATDADTRSIGVAGRDLPTRATVASTVVVLAVLFDYSRTLVPLWGSIGHVYILTLVTVAAGAL